MPPDDTLSQLQLRTFDDALGRRIIDMHIWAVREGLRGADAYELFDGYCQRLVIHHVPLWRGHTAMETLHPQWSGYGFTWRRDLNAIQPEQYLRGNDTEPHSKPQPFRYKLRWTGSESDTKSIKVSLIRHLSSLPTVA